MKKIALAIVALTAATPAFAQDVAAEFTGFQVSAIAGLDIVDLNSSEIDNPTGVSYGVNVGYDYQSGGVVFGIEGEAAESSARVKVAGDELLTASRDLYVGGRVGVVTNGALVYAKVGYTNFRVESIAGDATADGIRFGGGAEVKLRQNVFFKGEYRYSNYEAEVERHQIVAGLGVRF